jgi:hypothetical protein
VIGLAAQQGFDLQPRGGFLQRLDGLFGLLDDGSVVLGLAAVFAGFAAGPAARTA